MLAKGQGHVRMARREIEMAQPPYTPQSKTELLEVHACLFLSAPDNFVQLSNALPGERITLESTIEELHRGVDHVFRKTKHETLRVQLHQAINDAYKEFAAGRVHEGRMKCHRIEDLMKGVRP